MRCVDWNKRISLLVPIWCEGTVPARNSVGRISRSKGASCTGIWTQCEVKRKEKSDCLDWEGKQWRGVLYAARFPQVMFPPSHRCSYFLGFKWAPTLRKWDCGNYARFSRWNSWPCWGLQETGPLRGCIVGKTRSACGKRYQVKALLVAKYGSPRSSAFLIKSKVREQRLATRSNCGDLLKPRGTKR